MNRIPTRAMTHEGPPDLKVWRIDIDFASTLDAPAFAALSADEIERARRFHRQEDTLRHAYVRAALRDVLAERLGIAARDVRFARGPHGRPRIADHHASPLDFNVSHSGAHGLIAVSEERRVGVDIEQCGACADWHGLARSTLTPAEVTWIDSLPESTRPHAFCRAWVAKEALLKALGVGIDERLTHIAVLPYDSPRVRVKEEGAKTGLQDYAAEWIDVVDEYGACVAWSTTPRVSTT
jgi:4'-phosphopantetheinyl transferase